MKYQFETIFTNENEIKSNTPINLSNTSKEEIIKYYMNTNSLYEYLFSSISIEGLYLAPDPLRRHLIFYLGHTSVLYINKFKLAKISLGINENFENLFGTGVDPIYATELDNNKYLEIYPSLEEIKKYRERVFDKVIELINSTDLVLPIKKETVFWCIILCIEHERIHLETTTLLIRQLDLKYLIKPLNWKISEYSTENYPRNEFVSVNKENVVLGKKEDFPTFGWDNEYGNAVLDVDSFKATKFKISNGEYLEFYNDGGYDDKSNWSTEGWEWKELVNSKYPRFWILSCESKSKFKYRATFEEFDLPLNWPVEVNYHEATAYCSWLQKKNNLTDSFYRLIKEEEFKIIRGDKLLSSKNENPYSDFVAFSKKGEYGNVNLNYGSCTPVDKYISSPLGFNDTVGNVWEWSHTHFRPLPGFKPEYFYKDFSGGCYDYHHNLILGSGWSSTGMSSSIYVRIVFRRHFYQNCGFRVVEEQNLKVQEGNVYEKKTIIGEYISSFYYENLFEKNIFNSFPLDIDINYQVDFGTKIANYCMEYYKNINKDYLVKIKEDKLKLKALDLGCGVGKTSFVLTEMFDEVTGLDYSKSFIDICNTLKEKGNYEFEYLKNGEYYIKANAILNEKINRNRVKFLHGDAMNLPALIGPFDLICAVNLIDRLTNPIKCLMNLRNLLDKNGILIIVSPYTFMECYTPKEYWIGGKDGVGTFEALQEIMKGLCFDFIEDKTVSLFIREHERKFQLCLPNLSVWKKTKFCEEFATSIFK